MPDYISKLYCVLDAIGEPCKARVDAIAPDAAQGRIRVGFAKHARWAEHHMYLYVKDCPWENISKIGVCYGK